MCPPVPDMEHCTANTANAFNGTTVSFVCENGYNFASGKNETSSYCNGSNWSKIDDHCEGYT